MTLEATVEALFTLRISSSESPILKEPSRNRGLNKTMIKTHDPSGSSSMNSEDLKVFLTGARGLGRLKISQINVLTEKKHGQ